MKLVDNDRDSVPASKTHLFRKGMNMGIWVVRTLNQVFLEVEGKKMK